MQGPPPAPCRCAAWPGRAAAGAGVGAQPGQRGRLTCMDAAPRSRQRLAARCAPALTSAWGSPLPPRPCHLLPPRPCPSLAPSGDPSRLRRPSPPPAGTLPVHWGGAASVLLADPRTPPSSAPEADPLRGETAAGGPRVGQMPKNPAFSRPEPRLCGPGGEGSLGVLRTGGWPWAAGPRGGFTASCGSAADGSRPPGRACPLGDSNCPRRRLG